MWKSMHHLALVGAAAIGSQAAAATLTQYSDNFESYTDATEARANYNFVADGGGALNGWTFAATGGVGNSKYANNSDPAFSGVNATLKDSVGSFTFANVGDTMTLSVMYRDQGGSPTNNGRSVGAVGLVDSDSAYIGTATSNRIILRVNSDNTVNPVGETNAGGRRIVFVSENTTLTSALTNTGFLAGTTSSWYRLTLELTRRADNKFDYGLAVDSMGAAGTSAATSIFAHTGTTTAVSPLATDSTIYPGLFGRGGGNAGRWGGFDDFNVAIPEPGTLGLLAVGTAMMLRRRD